MKSLKAEIFYLIIFFTSGIQNELTHDAENVCPQNETYEVTIVEKVNKYVTELKRTRCFRPRRMFSCKKLIKKMKMVEEPRVVQRTRLELRCCSGYKEQTGNQQSGKQQTRCVPECPTGCVHGECIAPDKCVCTSGFHGRMCDKRSNVPTVTPITTAKRNSSAEISTQEISQATEESMTLMSEILEITNTDHVTQSTAEATVRMTGEVSDETSTTELHGIEDEGEISRRKSVNAKVSVAAEDVLNPPRSAKMPITTAKRNSSAEISTQEISQATEESMTLMSEILEITNTDHVTQSTAEATVRMTGEVSDETSTTELHGIEDEGEISRRKSVNAKVSVAAEDVLNPPRSAKMPAEEKTNTKTVLESEDASEPTKITKNPQIYYSTSVLYVTSTVIGFLLVVGWLVTVTLRRKIRRSKTEDQRTLNSKKQMEFPLENLFLMRDGSESLIKMMDAEPKNPDPVLLDLPVYDHSPITLSDKENICSRPYCI